MSRKNKIMMLSQLISNKHNNWIVLKEEFKKIFKPDVIFFITFEQNPISMLWNPYNVMYNSS